MSVFQVEAQPSVGAAIHLGLKSWTPSRRVLRFWLENGGHAIGVIPRLRVNVERICESNEEIEQRSVVDRLGDLLVRPAGVPQAVNLLVGDAVRVPGECAHEFE